MAEWTRGRIISLVMPTVPKRPTGTRGDMMVKTHAEESPKLPYKDHLECMFMKERETTTANCRDLAITNQPSSKIYPNLTSAETNLRLKTARGRT